MDPLLYEFPWYLNSIEIDGVSYEAPLNAEVPFVTAVFSETTPNFLSAVCDSAEGDIISVEPFTSFSFPSGLNITTVVCTDGDNEIFENLYFNNFFLDNIDQPFEYGIYIIDSEIPTYGLSIWWGEGSHWAHYFDEVLSIPTNELASITVFPNPVSETLNLKFLNEIAFPVQISLIDTSGRLFYTESLEQVVYRHQLDVQNVPRGFYFVQIVDDNGRRLTKKIIK
jgi:hypothetical protein